MHADEAADLMDKDKESDTFKQRAAVAIAVFAMVLAICGLGGGNATKDAVNNNVEAANTFAFYQAKNARQTSYLLAADQIELGFLADPALPAARREALEKKVADYRATVTRYESDPRTNEGKKELLVKANKHVVDRDHALKQDPYFDYAEALLQIAIVLISVSIIANLPWLAFFGGGIGILGIFFTINGFLLLVPVPGLS